MTLASLTQEDSTLRPVEGIEKYPIEFYSFMMLYFKEHMTHRVSPLHLEFCESVKYRRVGIAAPRQFAKSIILSCFYPIFLALREPKSQAVIVSATQFLAQNQIMQRIKLELETNELLIHDFGEMITDKWKADFLRLPNKSEILCRSVTSQVRGLHPTVMILDDAENDEEVITPEGRDQFMSFMKRRVMPTLNYEKCQLLMVGTILHPDSYLNRVCNGQEPGWYARLYRALTDEGESIWPHLFPKERLLEEKRTLGTDVFEQEFMNNPIPDGKRAFKTEWFKYIQASEIPPAVNRFVTVDPAIGQGEQNDDTAIVITAMDHDRNIYVEEVIAGHMIPNEIIQTLFSIYERKKILVTGIETVGFQKTLQYQIADESRRRHKYPIIEELKSDGTRKEWRIRALQPYFENGKVFFVKNNQGIEKLERQLLSFPTGRHDDTCFVAGTKIATPTGDQAIETLKAGDKVLTPFGVRKVLAAGLTGHKEVISKFGLEATPNHPVFVRGNGFLPIGSHLLTYISQLSRVSLKEMILWQFQRLLSSMASDSILTGRDAIIAADKEYTASGSILKAFMSRFGSFIPERKFQKTISFTTKTITLLTTTFLTWTVYRIANIVGSIRKSVGQLKNRIKDCATFAAKLISPIFETLNSVPQLASTRIQEGLANGALNPLALFVEMNSSGLTNISPQKHADTSAVTSSATKDVYNLTVDGEHCYYANGILVSNCDALAYLLQIMRPGQKPKAPAPHPDSFEAVFKARCERLESEKIWGNHGREDWLQ